MQQLSGKKSIVNEAKVTVNDIQKYLRKRKEVWLFYSDNGYMGGYIPPKNINNFKADRNSVWVIGYDDDPELVSLKDVEWMEVDGKKI